MKDLIAAHFEKIMEISVLVFVFVFGALMLAFVKNDEMARWIESGAIVAVLVRGFTNGHAVAPNTTNTNSSVTTTEIPADPNAPKGQS